MRYQSTPARCGNTALGEALAALGHRRGDDELATLCRTTAQGTDHRGLIGAVKKLQEPLALLGPLVIWEAQGEVAALKLEKALRTGRPAVLCVDNWGHYVSAIGLLGDRFNVSDSADDERLLYYAPAELAERWRCGPWEDEEGHHPAPRRPFWAVVL